MLDKLLKTHIVVFMPSDNATTPVLQTIAMIPAALEKKRFIIMAIQTYQAHNKNSSPWQSIVSVDPFCVESFYIVIIFN